jgi:hypothetical protein
MSEDLKIAQELGIENAESLTAAQLKKAVAAAQAKKDEEAKVVQDKLDASAYLKKVAEDLEISTEGLSDEEITAAIEAEGAKLLEEKQAQVHEEIMATLSEYLGVPDVRSLDLETVKSLLADKETEAASPLEVIVADDETIEEGKTDASFTDSKGREWVFADDAPAGFRCLGIERTQAEWMEDSDSMELFVEGDLSFLTLKK